MKKNIKNKILIVLLFFSVFLLGIGYADIANVNLNVNGTAKLDEQTGIYITNVSLYSSNNANLDESTINTWYQTGLNTTNVLNNSADSSITYEVTITSEKTTVYEYEKITYLNSLYDNGDITFALNGLTPGQLINPGQSITFRITFVYREDKPNYPNTTLNSYINFKFVEKRTKATLKTGSEIINKITSLASSKNNVHYIKKATTEQYDAIKDNLTNDNIVSIASSEFPVYMWYDNHTIYYYSEAQLIYMNQNSSSIFSGLSKLKTIDILPFDTSKVTNMSSMFKDCNDLEELDLSNFDTSKVTSMNSMFWSVKNKLKVLDLSNFDTSNVTNMYGMFYNCNSLEDLDVSSFNTHKVTNMASMFGNLFALTGLNLYNFDTSSVTTMDNMFNTSNKLTYLNVSSFDTSNVTTMVRMFASTDRLKTIDISSFNTVKVKNMEKMFSNCVDLQTIYVSDTFVTNIVTNSNSMFINDTNLVGANGTTYSASHTNKEYAVIDNDEHPGYFSTISN